MSKCYVCDHSLVVVCDRCRSELSVCDVRSAETLRDEGTQLRVVPCDCPKPRQECTDKPEAPAERTARRIAEWLRGDGLVDGQAISEVAAIIEQEYGVRANREGSVISEEAALKAVAEIFADHMAPCANCFGNALPDVRQACLEIILRWQRVASGTVEHAPSCETQCGRTDCDCGAEYLATTPSRAPQPEQDDTLARAIIKHISDATLELAFMRHDLTSDEVDVDDDADVKTRVAAGEQFCEEVKADTLACLTGDETGCLDPEDLNEANCELLWLKKVLVAPSPASGYNQGLSKALEIAEYYGRERTLARSWEGSDREFDEAVRSTETTVADVIAGEIRALITPATPRQNFGCAEHVQFRGDCDACSVATPSEDGWRDMKSAPKDGTVIRVYAPDFVHADFNPSGSFEAYWQDGEGFIAAVWNATFDGWDPKTVKPTHWMPLPVAPQSKEMK